MSGGGLTLPPFIVVSVGAWQNDPALISHEYGHILEFGAMTAFTANPIVAYGLYGTTVITPSLATATISTLTHTEFHHYNPTEGIANEMSYNFQGRPSAWGDSRFKPYSGNPRDIRPR